MSVKKQARNYLPTQPRNGRPRPVQLLTAEEVSEMLRIPVGTLQWWRAVGKGPNYILGLGRGVRYDEAEIIRYMDQFRRDLSAQAAKGKKRGAIQAAS